jgi:hypothetical protein
MARRRNTVVQTANELVLIDPTRDPMKFLEDVMACTALPVRTRTEAALGLMPYKYAKLHAIYTSATPAKSFEEWLDELQGPGKELMERELKLLAAPDIDDDPAGSA